MGIPKEPRQQMINMMYLVLTALLAMNVSKEVLDAFGVVNEGLASTNVAIEQKNTDTYKAFALSMKDDAEKTKPFKDLADEARQYADELYDYIEALKQEIIEKGGGYKVPGDPSSGLKKLDDIYVGTNLMVAEDNKDGKGYELQQKILDYRGKFLDIIDQADVLIEQPGTNRDRFESSLTLDAQDPEPPRKGVQAPSWESKNFNQVPIIAALTILTKFQSDARSAESSIVEHLKAQIGATDYKVDKMAAKVIAPSSYLSQGKEYSADIFIAAFNSTQENDVFLGELDRSVFDADSGGMSKINRPNADDIPIVGEPTKLEVEGGMGKYVTTASGVGERSYEGVIRVKAPTGGFDFYPFEAEYEVAPPSGFAVEATKMNVMYIGVDNPIKISVSGAKDNDVTATMTGGSISKEGNGKYTARVSTPGDAQVNVTAMIDGDRKNLGSAEFRVKRIPDPVPTLGGKLRGGKIQRGTLRAQSGIVPLLENFDFEARFNVITYEMVYSTKGEIFKAKGRGPLLTNEMKTYIDKAKPKDFIFIDEIKVKGPDGVPRRLNSIVFEII